jgi:putative effector of murein hydrolase
MGTAAHGTGVAACELDRPDMVQTTMNSLLLIFVVLELDEVLPQ